MRPNHHQLIPFAYVVRNGSFSAAAKRMGVTQSTITQHVGNLEKNVGTLLLCRGRDGVELTPAGQELNDLADRMVSLEAKVSERLEGFNAIKSGCLNVIANASQPALKIISNFRQRFPDKQVNFGLYDGTTATGMPRNRLADVGLIIDAPVSDMWDRIFIEETQYVLYCPTGHPIAGHDIVSISEMQSETLIVLENGPLTQSPDP